MAGSKADKVETEKGNLERMLSKIMSDMGVTAKFLRLISRIEQIS